jgi:hypothetical protein
MFLTGFPEIVARRKAGELGAFNPIPCPLIFGNCMGWLAYSFIKQVRSKSSYSELYL